MIHDIYTYVPWYVVHVLPVHAFEAKNTRCASIVVKIALKSLMNIFMKAFNFYVRGQSESFAVDA